MGPQHKHVVNIYHNLHIRPSEHFFHLIFSPLPLKTAGLSDMMITHFHEEGWLPKQNINHDVPLAAPPV